MIPIAVAVEKYDACMQLQNGPKNGKTETINVSCHLSQVWSSANSIGLALDIRQRDRSLIVIDILEWNESSRALKTAALRGNSPLPSSSLPACILYSISRKQIALRKRFADGKVETHQLTFKAQLDMEQVLQALNGPDMTLANVDARRPQTAPGVPMQRTMSRQLSSRQSMNSKGQPAAVAATTQTGSPFLSRQPSIIAQNQPPVRSSTPVSSYSAQAQPWNLTIGGLPSSDLPLSDPMPPPALQRPSTSHLSAYSIQEDDMRRPSTGGLHFDGGACNEQSRYFTNPGAEPPNPLPPRRLLPHMSSSLVAISSSPVPRPASQSTMITPPSLTRATATAPVSIGAPESAALPAKRPLSSASGNKRPPSKRANSKAAKASTPIIAPAISAPTRLTPLITTNVSNGIASSTQIAQLPQPMVTGKPQAAHNDNSACQSTSIASFDINVAFSADLEGWNGLPPAQRSAALDEAFDLRKLLTDDFITFCVDVEGHMNRVGLDHARKMYDQRREQIASHAQ